jgi:cytidyltransferase-like protein
MAETTAGRIRVAASGYFDPLHVGHVRYLKAARTLGDELFVIVNNDWQAEVKKGKSFMRAIERAEIVAALKYVDGVIIAFDHDRAVKQTLEWIRPNIFAKGGDSTASNTPETVLCDRLGIKLVFGIGGEKIQSSSWLISGSSQ